MSGVSAPWGSGPRGVSALGEGVSAPGDLCLLPVEGMCMCSQGVSGLGCVADGDAPG